MLYYYKNSVGLTDNTYMFFLVIGNSVVTWNRKVCCKEGIKNWKFCKLQRFTDDDHGDVCRRNDWPENRNWRCPKGCFKVWDGPTNGHVDKPFCVGKDKKACRV